MIILVRRLLLAYIDSTVTHSPANESVDRQMNDTVVMARILNYLFDFVMRVTAYLNPDYMFGLAIHQNDHQAKRRFVEWAQNEIAVVPDFHKLILFSDEAHFWLNGYVNKQNCRIWSEANPQVYVETPLHPEKLTGALYGLVESLVRTSSKTMKATT
ncbi:hypothetical protein TNCV_3310621 [Trichonephila clavipes]|nr:hypothetical protein TNCV_3310621 [Trichonephila clavipes]